MGQDGPLDCTPPPQPAPKGLPMASALWLLGVRVLGNGCVLSHQTLARSSSSVPESGHGKQGTVTHTD